MQGVVDRFESNKAVILYGPDEEYKLIFPRKYLAKNINEGDIVKITLEYDEAATVKAKAEAEELLNSLKNDNK